MDPQEVLSDDEEIFNEEEAPEEGFAIGKVVFPVEKNHDFVDPTAVVVNPVDSYIGKFMGKYLSEKVIGSGNAYPESDEEFEGEVGQDGANNSSSKRWKILGAFKDANSQIPPWLWAVIATEDIEAYIKEALKCSVIIYDVTDNPTIEKFDEIRAVCDALRERVPTFKQKRVFILISSVHSWSHTKPSNGRGESGDYTFSEIDYRRRRTKPLYRDLQLLERYVVASGKMTKGMLKAYVLGAGAVYGSEEGPFHHLFKSAWHNAKYLPIYGSGKNIVPTCYIKDLASIVQNVMDFTPKKQRYILAVDPVLCQQDQIVKAISQCLGTGMVKKISAEDIYLNRELNTFRADQLMLDLTIESLFVKENFDVDFAAEKGMNGIISKIVAEYKKGRNLEPLKVWILGPPGVGKSKVARQISDMYHLNHFTKEDIIKSTIEMLREIAGDPPEADIAGMDVEQEEEKRDTSKKLLAEVDVVLGPESKDGGENEIARKSVSQLEDEIVCKLFRYRLLTNQCQNQGFILDGFPENHEQARLLLLAGDDVGEFYGEEPGEDGKDLMDPRLVPDKVIILEGSDDFLIERMLTVPTTQLQERHQDKVYPDTLEVYRQKNESYENTILNYLDLQEMIYYPMDVTTDTSTNYFSIISKIADMLGRPHNYGLTTEQENALKNAQQFEAEKVVSIEEQDLAGIESKELEERKNNIQQWMEKLAKIKREEVEREEAALIPLRHYLMAHVVPTLTKGILEVTRIRPCDPVEYLAEFLFQHNPGSFNANSQQNKEQMAMHVHKPQTQ